MFESLQLAFIQNALVAGALAAVICGIVGALVVVKRTVFIAGGVSHAVYGGVGIAFFLGWPILPTAMGFAVWIAAIMAWVVRTQKHRIDAVIGVLWAAGMALGIILTDLTPGYQGELLGYLFGSILAVAQSEIGLMAGVLLFLLLLLAFYYQELLAITYDEEFARVRGVSVDLLDLLLLALIALTVVVVIRVSGLILVIALLTIAPLMVEPYANSLKMMMVWSSVLNLCFTLLGLMLSYQFNLTSGAAIIAVAVMSYGVSLLSARFSSHRL